MTPDFLRRPLFALAALALAALIGSTVLGKGGLGELLHLKTERSTLGEEAFRLLHTNEALRGRILALRRSGGDLERMARQELGLVRDGEIVYRFRSHAEPAAKPARAVGGD